MLAEFDTPSDLVRAAQAALTDWASGSVPVRLEGLVLLAHAPGRLSKQLRPLRELVRGAAAGLVWEIGWQPQWQTVLSGSAGGVVRMIPINSPPPGPSARP